MYLDKSGHKTLHSVFLPRSNGSSKLLRALSMSFLKGLAQVRYISMDLRSAFLRLLETFSLNKSLTLLDS